MSDIHVERLAQQVAALQAQVGGLMRTQQVARTVVGGVPVEETLLQATDTAGVVDGLGSDVARLDDGTLTDAWEAQQSVPVAEDYLDDLVQRQDDTQSVVESVDAWRDEQYDVYEFDTVEAEGISADIEQAQAEVAEAVDAAANAVTTANGKNSRRRGVTEPEPPAGGWVQGDQWVRDEDRDGVLVPVQVLVWNGSEFVSEQIIADDILIIGEDGTVRIADGKVTADSLAVDSVDAGKIRAGALNAQRIESPEIVGGVIEAPTIVSSTSVGVLANVLADPDFESQFDTSWLLSGFTGDAQATQVDTVTWDQSWTWNTGLVTATYRNWGAYTATLVIPPRERQSAGTIIRPNFSWLDKSARTISNPHTFTNLTGSSSDQDHLGGPFDPTFRKVDTRAPLAGVARTTYLTNANTFLITAGTRWRYKLEFSRLTNAQTAFVSAFNIQVIRATDSGVVFQYPITKAQLQSGNVVGYWDNTTHTGDVKYRLAITYTAGAGRNNASRKLNAAARAQRTRNGTAIGTQMTANSGFIDAPYAANPQKTNGTFYSNGTHTRQYVDRINTAIDVSYASFQDVETRSGWRITEENGLETFNSSGFMSGKFDGEDNFFSGRMASKESGARWEIEGAALALFDATGLPLGSIRGVGSGMVSDINTFALKSQLDAWTTAIDGTHAWVTSEGREYVRSGGVWWPSRSGYTEVTDWNNATQAGTYGAVSAANGPTGGWYMGTVTVLESQGRILQELREAKGTTFDVQWSRYWNGSSWSAWSDRTEQYNYQTFTFKSPYSLYGTQAAPEVVRHGKTVFLNGIGAVSDSSNIATGADMFTTTLPDWARPQRPVYQICQGSSQSRWLLVISTAGRVTGERYYPASTANNLWLPFSVSYLAAD